MLSRQWGVLVAMVLGCLPLASNADIIMDLRFSDGGKFRVASAGTYPVNIWAQVTGTNNLNDEELLNIYGSVQSQQIYGGAVQPVFAGTSGVTSISAAPGFTLAPSRGSPGTAQNITADNVQDWGTTSTGNGNTIKFNTDLGDSSGATYAFLNSPGVTANAISSPAVGVEFLIGSFQVTVSPGDISGIGYTAFNWVRGSGAVPAPGVSKLDGSASPTSGQNNSVPVGSDVVANNGVVFGLPEPASVGLIGLVSLGLLGIRRRKI